MKLSSLNNYKKVIIIHLMALLSELIRYSCFIFLGHDIFLKFSFQARVIIISILLSIQFFIHLAQTINLIFINITSLFFHLLYKLNWSCSPGCRNTTNIPSVSPWLCSSFVLSRIHYAYICRESAFGNTHNSGCEIL